MNQWFGEDPLDKLSRNVLVDGLSHQMQLLQCTMAVTTLP